MESDESLRALVVDHDGGETDLGVRELSVADLHEGEVVVRVGWSSVNYKDALAGQADGGVARTSPLIPGIDLAGEIVEGEVEGAGPGDPVVVHGYEMGVSHHGGFAELARVPAGWVVPMPDGLDGEEAMTFGTAGYTAALSLLALEERGLTPGEGPLLVTGASGGVGSMAVAMAAARGHEVVAATGKDERDWLCSLGASDVIDREETTPEKVRPLDKARWAGAIDPVGGATLPYVLSTLRVGAAVAASGNAGGMKLETTVLPFILRGTALLGIDSAQTPIERRREVWQQMAGDLRPPELDVLRAQTVDLDGVADVFGELLDGAVRGRTVVLIGG